MSSVTAGGLLLSIKQKKFTPEGELPTARSIPDTDALGIRGCTTAGSAGPPSFLRIDAAMLPSRLFFLSFPIVTVSERICLHNSLMTRMPTAFISKVQKHISVVDYYTMTLLFKPSYQMSLN